MDINYVWVLIAVVAQFVLGALWYSPLLFGGWWMQIMEKTDLSKAELQKMQKQMAPFYALQLLLTFVSTMVLVMFVHYLHKGEPSFHAYGVAGWVWVGFIAPTQIASVVWANTKRQFWAKQIFVMTSYQLVSLMLTAYLISR